MLFCPRNLYERREGFDGAEKKRFTSFNCKQGELRVQKELGEGTYGGNPCTSYTRALNYISFSYNSRALNGNRPCVWILWKKRRNDRRSVHCVYISSYLLLDPSLHCSAWMVAAADGVTQEEVGTGVCVFLCFCVCVCVCACVCVWFAFMVALKFCCLFWMRICRSASICGSQQGCPPDWKLESMHTYTRSSRVRMLNELFNFARQRWGRVVGFLESSKSHSYQNPRSERARSHNDNSNRARSWPLFPDWKIVLPRKIYFLLLLDVSHLFGVPCIGSVVHWSLLSDCIHKDVQVTVLSSCMVSLVW